MTEVSAHWRDRCAVRPMDDSTALLDDPDALRARYRRDGYLLLRGVVPEPDVAAIRRSFLAECDAGEWLAAGHDAEDRLPDPAAPCVEPQPAFRAVYDRIFAREDFHAIPHHPALLRVMEMLLETTPLVHPRKIGRLIFPRSLSADDYTTPAHQDWVAIQGSTAAISCWMPLHDVLKADGGLMMARGSHRQGMHDYVLALGAGAYEVAACETLDWRATDYRAGDIVLFNTMTVHAALPNAGSRLRLSMDFRYQDPTAPITEDCLVLKGAPYDWDDIYGGWASHKHRYYWRERDLNVVAVDPSHYAQRDAVALDEGRKGNRIALSALHRIAAFHADPATSAEAKRLIAAMTEAA